MRWWTLLLLIAGCAPDEDRPKKSVDDCATGGATELALLSKVSFVRDASGVSRGFDLDGETSSAGGPSGCGVGDQVDPDGNPGIDNSFARLMPALEQTEAAALESVIQEAIRSGGLLAVIQLDDVEDPFDDACVDLSLTNGVGLPMIGADGEVLPYQTFHRDPDAPVSRVDALSIEGGVVEGGPLDLDLPFAFLDADIVFHVEGVQLRLERHEDGRLTGLLGGGIAIQDLSDLAHNTGISAEVEDLLDSVLGFAADLAPNEAGECEQISVVLDFEAIPAFFYD